MSVPPTILICDDEPTLLELAETLLAKEGYSVITSGTGKEALDMLIDGLVPNLILLDERLPDMAGHDLRAVIVKMLPRVRVAYLTGSVNTLNGGANPTLFKPFDPKALLNFVKLMLKEPSDPTNLA